MEVAIFTYKGPDEREEESTKPFSVGYFDFPMIDNTRLSNGQRFAIVLNELDTRSAHITLVCFPGSYASLKDKPYYDEIIDNLKMTKAKGTD